MVIVKERSGAAIRAAVKGAAKRKAGRFHLVSEPAGVYSVETKAIYLKKGVRIVWEGK